MKAEIGGVEYAKNLEELHAFLDEWWINVHQVELDKTLKLASVMNKPLMEDIAQCAFDVCRKRERNKNGN